MNLKSILKSGIMAGALTLVPLVAGATTFTVSQQGSGFFNGTSYANAHISSGTPAVAENVAAGGFAMKGDLHNTGMTDNFIGWCLDIVTPMLASSKYLVTTTPFQSLLSDTQKSNIERLFETGFHGLDLTVGANSGGFQLALWEIMYETPGDTFKLGDGNFQATGDKSLIDEGNALLAGMSKPISQSYSLTWLQSYDLSGNRRDGHISQNLVTASAVPLPAGGLLLAGALAGLTALRRRKAARA